VKNGLRLAAVLAIATSGCGHTETHQAMLRPAEPPTGRPVELYLADQPMPARPFYEVALVEAIGFGSDAHPEDVARALEQKASRIGCDAVVRTFIDQGYARARAAGVCVKWLGPGAPAAPAELPRGAAPRAPPEVRPTPAPRMEPLPSAGPGAGGGK
jgi:hypothetical protein